MLVLRWTPLVALVSLAAAVSLGGCHTQEEVEMPAEPAKAAQTGPSCDDFDSYCDKAHPCPEGTHCAFDPGNCGTNFFGTYPSCGATDTCYPACQPNPSCDDFDSYCDATHPCPTGTHCELDTSHCGTNFFGQYPNCGATNTCYPACQPD